MHSFNGIWFGWLALAGCLLPGAAQAQVLSRPTFRFTRTLNEAPQPNAVLKKPESFAVSLTGDLYVADTGNNRLVKLDADGGYVAHVGGFGWRPNQFDTPLDVACPDGLNIYVADFNNRRIQRYNKYLELISSLGSSKVTQLSADQTRKDLDIGTPAGVAVSSQGDLFSSDPEQSVILKINRFARLDARFGGFSTGRGRLTRPARLTTTGQFVYVVDESRIVRFDYYGNPLGEITEGLERPVDVAVDGQGRCYVADAGRRTVLVFDPSGQPLTALQGHTFEGIKAVDILRDRLYVLDAYSGTIAVFQVVESEE